MEPFVHLHVHTEYSLLDGANPIEKLVKAAVADGHDALAITDHGNLFGALEFYQACRKHGVKPILGCEVYVAEKSMSEPHSRRGNAYSHLTLLANDAVGWRNLMQLSSAAHIEGYHFRPRVDLELIASKAAGLTCLSGCMSGPVNKLLRVEDEKGAIAMAARLQDMFGRDHFFLEVMRNGIAVQDKLTEGMARLRGAMNAPLIATNDIHYLRQEDCAAQDAMICLHTGSRLDDPDRWRMDSDTLYFRSREEMNRIFSDLPEALRNTQMVADRIDVDLELGRKRLPVFRSEDGRPPQDQFRELCEKGFAQHYPGNPDAARKRLEFEIGVITEMGFISYFLIVWDLIRHAHEQGIPVGPGRGSAAGSMVAYVLGITRIDPLRYDLLFERFLNPSRISMPDIDIDFCKDRREEMIQYTRQRYGEENVCQIITFGKLKAKNALRDMGRILEIPLAEVDKVAKRIPDGPGVKLGKAIEENPELKELFDNSEQHRKWFDLALKVEGLARNSGIHAAGVIIADEPLREIIPLAKISGNLTTQWDMVYSEQFGLLKMDFLGLRTLSILHEAVSLLRRRSDEHIDLDALPLDDAATYELLCKADTEGVFQLESNGMRQLLADIRPSGYEDIIAVLALFRPGPLGSGLHQTYAKRKHGAEDVSFQHPILEPILKETYGVLIYQEQIMRVAQRMGGFTLAEADSLRKAMSKKDAELMAQFDDKFLQGALQQGVPEAVATNIWEMMMKFGDYGFNKSHSAAYAMVTYQAAWMKAHHSAEFYAASFTYEASDSDKLRSLIEDARKHAIRLEPPCINTSARHFLVLDGERIRFGLEAIKGVGGGAAETLVGLREQRDGERFLNLDEVLVDGVAANINRSTFDSLTKAGAFDSFGESRVRLLPQLEDRLRYASGLAKDRARGQGLLFEGPADPPSVGSAATDGDADASSQDHKELSKAELKLLLQQEKETLGLYLTAHPLDDYRHLLGGISPWTSRSAKEAGADAKLVLPGIATLLTVNSTRKDPSRKFAKLKIEDLYGSTPAIVFHRVYQQVEDFLKEDFIGIFHGRIQLTNDEPMLLVDRIEPLGDKEDMRLKGGLEIHLGTGEQPIPRLQDLLRHHPGESRVRFLMRDSHGNPRSIRAGKEWSVDLTPQLIEDLNRLLGPDCARAAMERGTVQRQRPAWSRS